MDEVFILVTWDVFGDPTIQGAYASFRAAELAYKELLKLPRTLKPHSFEINKYKVKFEVSL